MNLLIVTSECFPYAKTGGMGEVVFALSKALSKLNTNISIVIPYYSSVQDYLAKKSISVNRYQISINNIDKQEMITVFHWKNEEKFSFFAINHNLFFGRKELYGDIHGDYGDNAKRFSFFCHAVLHVIVKLLKDIHIIHCHDWQTALIPVLLKTEKSFYFLSKKIKTMLTIHNLAYQGIFPKGHLSFISQNQTVRDSLLFYEGINFLKSGLLFADVLSTVSPQYCKELQKEPLAEGFSRLFTLRKHSFFGILNGIDTEYWNPLNKRGHSIAYNEKSLEKKIQNKKRLFKKWNWEYSKECLFIGMISRIVSYKGFDLLLEIIHRLDSRKFAFVILGMGEVNIEKSLAILSKRYPQFQAFFQYSDNFAHDIYAAMDAFLMPSFFEPCGLTQMIAMTYGSVPVVNATGGLIDTVMPLNKEGSLGKGVLIPEYTGMALFNSINRLRSFYLEEEEWLKVVQHNMQCDFSWKSSAQKYLALYHHMDRM